MRQPVQLDDGMKLHPPEAPIEENDPFNHALFDRKQFAESLTGLLKNVEESLVVFVNAPWGEGKTTFSKMWRADLHRQKLDAIYFDAYAADYFDDPFVCFSGEILEFIDKRFEKSKAFAVPRREFKKTAVEVGKRLTGLAVKVGLRAATLGVVGATHLAELKELASGISEIGSDLVEKKIGEYSTEKDALKAFKKSLAKLAAAVREEQGFPLTIIVDELDRCRPDFALGLLERIKHLFDVPDVAFVLLVHRDQIESYIRTVYGDRVDARAYLLKFANLFVDLPNRQQAFRHGKGRYDYCRILLEHHGFATQIENGSTFQRSLTSLIEHFPLTLRELEKVFAIMALYYGSLQDGYLTNEFLVTMLSIFKVKRPDLYEQLRTGTIRADQFFRETKLNRLKEGNDRVSQEWINDMLNFCLMTNSELDELGKKLDVGDGARRGPRRMEGILDHYNVARTKFIPILCEGLDRFSLQP